MRARVISEFETVKGIIQAGQIIEISAAILERLKGKVAEVVTHSGEKVESVPLAQTGKGATLPVEIIRAGIVYALPHRCYGCRSTDLWLSRHGVTVCRTCHPPAPRAEKLRGLEPGKHLETGGGT